MFRDIEKGAEDTRLAAQRIALANADIVVLLGVDYDLNGLALSALADKIAAIGGPLYPTRFALRPNTGMASGQDLDGDGRRGEPEDAQGYGAFSGAGGMAILSRWPVRRDGIRDFSGRLWRSFEWATLPATRDGLFPSAAAYDSLRLSTTGHWIVPVALPRGGSLPLAVYHATPPVFDGPEDRNGLRNADETLFWVQRLAANPDEPLVIIGGANLDPNRGDGRRGAIRSLLDHPALIDPFAPDSLTVDWSDIGLGKMRTDYILPTRDWAVTGSGTIWPPAPSDQESRHALIWVDLSSEQ